MGGSDLTSPGDGHAWINGFIEGTAANCIDNDTGTHWAQTAGNNNFFQYEFDDDTEIIEFTITSRPSFADQAPNDFDLLSSVDGVNWVTEISVINETGWSGSGETRTFN